MKLLYRAQPFNDECFAGYLCRLAYWNGFKDGVSFLRALQALYRRLTNGTDLHHRYIIAALESAIGRHFDEAEYLRAKVTVASLREVKICRICWREKPYVRFYWRHADYSICHKHDVLLSTMSQISFDSFSEMHVAGEIDTEVNVFDNCALKNAIIKKMTDLECDEYQLSFEIDFMRKEIEVWGAIFSFMENYFSLPIGVTDISELIDHDSLMFLSAVDRFEILRNIVLNKFPNDAKLVNVIIFVQSARYHVVSNESRESELWFLSESYAISPILFGYLGGIGRNLFDTSMYGSDETLPPIPLRGFTDRQICKFILESSIFSDRELSNIYQDGKRLASGEVEPNSDLYKRACKFHRYLDAIGQDIFLRVPIQRIGSDALFELC